ncbi:hypothetical protein SAMN02745181_3605 [Rubritalea squalenifaciens DSM 18772]|uniref:ThuA-like domain-containing protein n=1 Tax=Rubritalea squalenifaciens DSM 18772 TaxID=1123071 RepID=A0A1M6RIA6_9BACT|nr:ThuA domain-containing protein [Rubritalea squalenifaciens]SHK32108.1 hypothetical protein SAMN02745181_3605 [Rubritalea squalenifaciens DSM 18772]
MKLRSIPLAMALLGLCGVGLMAVAQKKDEKEVSKQEKVAAALPEKAPAEAKKKRKLLVFSVTRGFRHGSIGTGKMALQMMGEKTGAYEAVVSDDLANFEEDKIKQFDAICFLNTTMEVFLPPKGQWNKMSDEEKKKAEERDARLKKNLLQYVKNGGGFVGIHAASDTFYKWSEYGDMLGGYFDGHPWRSNTSVSIKVEKGKEKHPIVANLNGESLNFKEEIYQLKDPYDSSKVNMLLRLDTEKSDMKVKGIKRTDNDFGVSWTKPYGEGRVFYCSLGHNDYIYWHPKVLGIYLAGIQWACGDLEVE